MTKQEKRDIVDLLDLGDAAIHRLRTSLLVTDKHLTPGEWIKNDETRDKENNQQQ